MIARWNKGEFAELSLDLFKSLKEAGKEKLGYLIGQYFAIGDSYRGKITDIDIDLTSDSKKCDVFIVAVIRYINKKGKDASMRYRLNDYHSSYDELYYAEDEDGLKLYLELKDK